jgi:uncharacterized protein
VTISAIYSGTITHTRVRPVHHRLRYRGLYLLFDLDELPALTRDLRLFSTRGFNLFGFCARDHGNGSDELLRSQIETQLRRAGIEPDGGAIRLLCMPRVLGTAFNPLSVYFCHHVDGTLAATIYEVHNTFGERHSYVIPVATDGTGSVSRIIRQSCAKSFYVSPFMDMALTYHFRVKPPEERVSVAIETRDDETLLMTAAFSGTRVALSDANLLRMFVRHPLLAAQVLGGIHWEALKLWRKGLKLRPRPASAIDTRTVASDAQTTPR